MEDTHRQYLCCWYEVHLLLVTRDLCVKSGSMDSLGYTLNIKTNPIWSRTFRKREIMQSLKCIQNHGFMWIQCNNRILNIKTQTYASWKYLPCLCYLNWIRSGKMVFKYLSFLKWIPHPEFPSNLTHCGLITPHGDTVLGQHRPS